MNIQFLITGFAKRVTMILKIFRVTFICLISASVIVGLVIGKFSVLRGILSLCTMEGLEHPLLGSTIGKSRV